MTPKTNSSMVIHLAVDGSEHALAGARFLRDLALPAFPSSTIHALAVLTPRHTPDQPGLQSALERVREILQGSHAEVRAELLTGHPAEALANYAEAHHPDLMVIGAQGLRATLGILLGGVAQQIVEYARWPVLVVQAPYVGLRRVLLAADGSPHSQAAAEYLARFPFPPDMTFEAMHVLPPPLAPSSLVYLGAPDSLIGGVMSLEEAEQVAAEQNEFEERVGRGMLQQAEETFQAHGRALHTILTRGDAATEIIRHLRQHSVDLVVAGSRGLSAVKGWLLGSVSRKLVHYAGCSVLIVRAEGE